MAYRTRITIGGLVIVGPDPLGARVMLAFAAKPPGPRRELRPYRRDLGAVWIARLRYHTWAFSCFDTHASASHHNTLGG